MNFKEAESSQKLSGSYYTPYWLAKYIMHWVLNEGATNILEPSCGDGVFFDALPNTENNLSVTGLDINNMATSICVNKLSKLPIKSTISTQDFLQWSINNLISNSPKTFDAVVGNPPFIRYQYLDKEMQERAQQLFKLMGMKFSKHTNAWIPFVISSIKFLNAGGHLGMILPSELLHVLYAKGLRDYLLQECSRILIIDPEDLWFEDTLQGVIVLMAEKKYDSNQKTDGIAIIHTKGQSFTQENPSNLFANADYVDGDFLKDKWTYALLTANERQVYKSICSLPNVYNFSDLATADVGIVTGANKFFLVSDDVVKKYNLQAVAHPMFGRSEHCPGIIYNKAQHDENAEKGLPTNFLYFCNKDDDLTYQEYLKLGESEGLPSRYKCRIRTPWYKVPSVSASPISMLKRSNGMPRLILNELNAYTTDTAYRITPTDRTDANSLVICFLNTLTALSAELEGRHYGGGVLELVPSEIDRLKVPYITIPNGNIYELNTFVKHHSIEEILQQQDSFIFSALGVNKADVKTLQNALIRIKDRRQRITESEN